MVRYTLEQRVFLYDSYVKYGSTKKCRRKFRRKFHDERVAGSEIRHSLVNKPGTTRLLIVRKQKHKRQVLIGEKLDDKGTRL
jgi:hypothetical protein